MTMEMTFRYSEQVERYHFGKKSDIHFQLANERKNLAKQQSIALNEYNNFYNKSPKKKLQRSSTTMDNCLRNENFYCKAKKLSIFDDLKCNVVLMGTRDSIKLYKSQSKYVDLLSVEPDAIIPYNQIKLITFFKSLNKMNHNCNKKVVTFEMNPKIETPLSQNYTFRFSNQHIVSATPLQNTSMYPKETEISDDSDFNPQAPKNNNANCTNKKSKKNKNCILGYWCRLFKKKNKEEMFSTDSIKKQESSPTSKIQLTTITKECCFQTRLPIQNIDLNTSELFQQSVSVANFDQYSNVNNDDYTPAKPQSLTHAYMCIYVNPDYNVNNPKFLSTLNLYDLRFQMPSYSAILLRRYIQASYGNNESSNSLKRIKSTIKINPYSNLTVSKYKDLFREESVDEDEVCVPPIDVRSKIMTNELYIAISDYLPPSSTYQNLVLLYSSDVHGTSLKTLYTKCQHYSDVEYGILLIKENTGNVIGAIISQLPKISKYYYGNGSSSVFRYEPKIQYCKNFKWSGLNSYIIKGDSNSIWIGGGKSGASIWLNEDLIHGRTQLSETFLNEQLSDNEHFQSIMVELWTFESS